MLRSALLALLVVALVVVGCGGSATIPVEVPTTLASEHQRITSPQVGASDLQDLVVGDTAFAFDLYQALREQDGNLFFSPHSISIALAMTYAGARGLTEQEMAETLHYLLSQDRLHAAFNALDQELAKRVQGAAGKEGEAFRLNVVNALWGQKDYPFLAQYLDTLAENYGAGMNLVDFINATEASRIAINRWVEDQTEGRIKNLIPRRAVDEYTRLVLTNAIYFNAAWLYAFDKGETRDEFFHLLNDSMTIVPMMHQQGWFHFTEGDGYQAVELPYDGEELSMVILLPDPGQYEAFESTLSADRLNSILDGLTYQELSLTIPRFEFDSDFSLKETLETMGMPLAFSDEADFSGMTGNTELRIQDVLHKAFVCVDEDGTEAAASTAVSMTSGISEPKAVTVDRPFMFLIRDVQTNSILFLGRVLNPVV